MTRLKPSDEGDQLDPDYDIPDIFLSPNEQSPGGISFLNEYLDEDVHEKDLATQSIKKARPMSRNWFFKSFLTKPDVIEGPMTTTESFSEEVDNTRDSNLTPKKSFKSHFTHENNSPEKPHFWKSWRKSSPSKEVQDGRTINARSSSSRKIIEKLTSVLSDPKEKSDFKEGSTTENSDSSSFERAETIRSNLKEVLEGENKNEVLESPIKEGSEFENSSQATPQSSESTFDSNDAENNEISPLTPEDEAIIKGPYKLVFDPPDQYLPTLTIPTDATKLDKNSKTLKNIIEICKLLIVDADTQKLEKNLLSMTLTQIGEELLEIFKEKLKKYELSNESVRRYEDENILLRNKLDRSESFNKDLTAQLETLNKVNSSYKARVKELEASLVKKIGVTQHLTPLDRETKKILEKEDIGTDFSKTTVTQMEHNQNNDLQERFTKLKRDNNTLEEIKVNTEKKNRSLKKKQVILKCYKDQSQRFLFSMASTFNGFLPEAVLNHFSSALKKLYDSDFLLHEKQEISDSQVKNMTDIISTFYYKDVEGLFLGELVRAITFQTRSNTFLTMQLSNLRKENFSQAKYIDTISRKRPSENEGKTSSEGLEVKTLNEDDQPETVSLKDSPNQDISLLEY
ncbi:hypothetical protein NCAS_0I02430 [Naumovozyma castellii]|uniref:Uncharacterized protein n=1 Tax=Naumovozyma castellii TaxID=27288 RepID=G0VK77_NAUCA|nr:hypothetical protein NCAS_0I02430 [Naumovozyma castellii CBS 4309]CCC71911.1 hypothetical protein NCAS_0I02430 [Naumovozyma castellii CBS 4309]